MLKFENEKNIKTRVVMSRSSDGFVYLSIDDEASCKRIIELKMNAEQVMALVTTLSFECDATYCDSKKVGKRMENKNVFIPVYGDVTRENVHQVYAEAEKSNEGWAADRGNYNYKLHDQKAGTYTVTMRRWV